MYKNFAIKDEVLAALASTVWTLKHAIYEVNDPFAETITLLNMYQKSIYKDFWLVLQKRIHIFWPECSHVHLYVDIVYLFNQGKYSMLIEDVITKFKVLICLWFGFVRFSNVFTMTIRGFKRHLIKNPSFFLDCLCSFPSTIFLHFSKS